MRARSELFYTKPMQKTLTQKKMLGERCLNRQHGIVGYVATLSVS